MMNFSNYDDIDAYYDGNGTTTATQAEDESQLCSFDPHPAGTLAQTYVHSLICVFGLLGNLLVTLTYARYKRSLTMTDLFLLNVAVADLLFAAALPLTIYNEQHGWPMATGACKAARGLYSFHLYAGTLLLACVGVDRYVAVVQARRFFGSARSRPRLVCAAVWAVAVALSFPTLIYTERLVENAGSAAAAGCGTSFVGDTGARRVKVLLPALQVAVGFLLPLAVMAFCYGSVLRHLLGARVGDQRRKALRVVLAVVVVFVACHLPYNAALLSRTLALFVERLCAHEKTRLAVLEVSRSVAYLHCCVNPVLYAFVGVKFRRHFRKILQDMWCLATGGPQNAFFIAVTYLHDLETPTPRISLQLHPTYVLTMF
ncbi:hypothetical protein NHX12_019115 [Muraenolepis orangiensis]|uniref:G-protein coupled receptors family 1 profile domain-containing protein n=1 Tax=Muraenolepis orangiensis TaxID=630683 RepID=A0A9Q0EWL1_9TELE|nr:hypothetical protein NHX12_019115 [Muraenolepis orangiensis]